MDVNSAINDDMVAFRLPHIEKRALKVLAAEGGKTLSDFILDTLREATDVKTRMVLLAENIQDNEQNDHNHEHAAA